MSTFVALIACMAALALACVVPPLLRRPAGPAPGTRPQPHLALLLAVALPAAAAALYLQVGRPDALAMPVELLAAAAAPADHGPAEQDIPAMVERLATRLRSQPDDVDGWHMLARSYSVMHRYGEAADAYAQLAALLPRDAGVLADYADALATARHGVLAGEPERLAERALAIDPQQVKALALSGSAAFARGDFARAEAQWLAVLPQVPEDSEFARSTQAGIAEARARQGLPAAGAVAAPAPAAGAAAGLSGTLRLAPGSAAPPPGHTLFIYARAADGPAMPLAAIKRKAGQWPQAFRLDDRHVLAPGASLAGARRLIVGARISASGSATAQPGDMEGESGPAAPGASGLVIELAPRAVPGP